MQISLDKIEIGPWQGRGNKSRTPERIADMAESIKSTGIEHKIVVRPHPTKKGIYQIASGVTRFLAAESLGWKEMDCDVRNLSDKECWFEAGRENIVRNQFSPDEERNHVATIIEQNFKDAKTGKIIPFAEIARVTGIPSSKLRDNWEAHLTLKDNDMEDATLSNKAVEYSKVFEDDVKNQKIILQKMSDGDLGMHKVRLLQDAKVGNMNVEVQTVITKTADNSNVERIVSVLPTISSLDVATQTKVIEKVATSSMSIDDANELAIALKKAPDQVKSEFVRGEITHEDAIQASHMATIYETNVKNGDVKTFTAQYLEKKKKAENDINQVIQFIDSTAEQVAKTGEATPDFTGEVKIVPTHVATLNEKKEMVLEQWNTYLQSGGLLLDKTDSLLKVENDQSFKRKISTSKDKLREMMK